MLKLTLEQILTSIEALSPQEKDELQKKLAIVFTPEKADKEKKGCEEGWSTQSMNNTIGDIEISGSNTALNYQPSQAGRDINTSSSFVQQSSEKQELQQALLSLKEAIKNTENLPDLSKIGAAAQADQLAAEVQKEEPDKNLIGHTISALKEGLKGITDLAGPVATVSSLVAKAWGIPV